MSATASELFQYLESIAPLHLQEDYDNSGLLIGSTEEEVKGLLISLDCTEDVLEEALQLNCNVIISHHPAIFYGLKKITGSNMTERIVLKAIKEGLIIYAIHTNLDNVLKNGVNEKIAQQLGLKVEGVLRKSNPHDHTIGSGLIGSFSKAVSEGQFLELLKEKMKAKVIRHSRMLDRPIEKVAICGGSGSFLLEDACLNGAQAFLTGDYKYHGFFEADGRIMICDIGHYESEQFTMNLLQELIVKKFTTFAAHCTKFNTNPIHYFT